MSSWGCSAVFWEAASFKMSRLTEKCIMIASAQSGNVTRKIVTMNISIPMIEAAEIGEL